MLHMYTMYTSYYKLVIINFLCVMCVHPYAAIFQTGQHLRVRSVGPETWTSRSW